MKNKTQYFFIAALFVFFLYFSCRIFADFQSLEIVFLDIGQGDSILIQKGTRQILIDGGPSGKTELAKLGEHLPYLDREIDIVVATHPDRDHIAGLVDVARNYKIGKVIATGAEKDTTVFKEWKEILNYNKTEILEAMHGDTIDFSGTGLRIVFPETRVDPSAGDANNKSIVARLDFKESSFLFTGDIEAQAEKEILAGRENMDIDFLKVAHHGSKYSSSGEFLDAASPAEAIISVGADNSYGHPGKETLERLGDRNIKILRTDESGDIKYICQNKNCHR